MPTCIRTTTKITWPSQSTRKQNTRDIPVLLISIWNTSSLGMCVLNILQSYLRYGFSTQHTLYLLTISSVLYKTLWRASEQGLVQDALTLASTIQAYQREEGFAADFEYIHFPGSNVKRLKMMSFCRFVWITPKSLLLHIILRVYIVTLSANMYG